MQILKVVLKDKTLSFFFFYQRSLCWLSHAKFDKIKLNVFLELSSSEVHNFFSERSLFPRELWFFLEIN